MLITQACYTLTLVGAIRCLFSHTRFDSFARVLEAVPMRLLISVSSNKVSVAVEKSCQKLVFRVSSGVPNTSKQEKHSACGVVLSSVTPDKTLALVFDIHRTKHRESAS